MWVVFQWLKWQIIHVIESITPHTHNGATFSFESVDHVSLHPKFLTANLLLVNQSCLCVCSDNRV